MLVPTYFEVCLSVVNCHPALKVTVLFTHKKTRDKKSAENQCKAKDTGACLQLFEIGDLKLVLGHVVCKPVFH